MSLSSEAVANDIGDEVQGKAGDQFEFDDGPSTSVVQLEDDWQYIDDNPDERNTKGFHHYVRLDNRGILFLNLPLH